MKLHKLLNIGLLSIAPIGCLTSITACGPKGEEEDPTKCKLKLDANGGLYDDGEATSSLKVNKSSYYSQIQDTIKKPTRNLYKFKAYSIDKTNPIDSGYQFNDGSLTLYALWEKETTVNITFDANGGNFEQSSTVTKEVVSGTLLKNVQINNPTYQGYTFNGWTIDQKVVLDENYALKTNAILKANWIDEANTVSVTINKNLEETSSETINVPKGTVIKTLGSRYSRTGYVFRCFGDAGAGTQISNNLIVNSTMSIKVWWKSDGTSEEASVQDYIYNRSFSIIDNEVDGIGTCWILADATPGDLTDFKYYIATNLHVRVGIEQTTTGYMFTDTKDVISTSSTAQFTAFSSFTWEEKSLFTYDLSKPQDAIDLSIATADFTNATGDTKTKLQNLNKRQGIEGCITEFVDSVSEQQHYETISVASTGGYGATSTSGYQWEYHPYLQLEFVYNFPAGHSTNDPTYSNDASPQYRLKGTEEVEWMRPGSSGSMLVGKDTDNTWKVLGIYWGGQSTIPGGTTGIPYFSCFNSDKKNFIDRYCTYHLNY